MTWHVIVDFIARFLLISYFVKAGVNNLKHPMPIIGMIARKGLPLPSVVYGFVIIIQLLGSLMILFHFYAAIGALGLILFTVLSNLLFCTYWKMEGNDRRNIGFLFDANVAIIGGLLLILII